VTGLNLDEDIALAGIVIGALPLIPSASDFLHSRATRTRVLDAVSRASPSFAAFRAQARAVQFRELPPWFSIVAAVGVILPILAWVIVPAAAVTPLWIGDLALGIAVLGATAVGSAIGLANRSLRKGWHQFITTGIWQTKPVTAVSSQSVAQQSSGSRVYPPKFYRYLALLWPLQFVAVTLADVVDLYWTGHMIVPATSLQWIVTLIAILILLALSTLFVRTCEEWAGVMEDRSYKAMILRKPDQTARVRIQFKKGLYDEGPYDEAGIVGVGSEIEIVRPDGVRGYPWDRVKKVGSPNGTSPATGQGVSAPDPAS